MFDELTIETDDLGLWRVFGRYAGQPPEARVEMSGPTSDVYEAIHYIRPRVEARIAEVMAA